MKIYSSGFISAILIALQLLDFEGGLAAKYVTRVQERLEDRTGIMVEQPVDTPSHAQLVEIIESGADWSNLNHRNTLVRFQAENNITVDGIYGPITERALNDFSKMTIDRIPPELMSENLFIALDTSRRILTVYQRGEVLRKYPVAVGEGDLTPETKTEIANRVVNPYWGGAGRHDPVPGGDPNNPLGAIWLGLRFGGGSVYGIHGNAAPYSIGQSVSLGCVRMINEDVEELYNMITIGAKVWIGTTSTLQSWGIEKEIIYQ